MDFDPAFDREDDPVFLHARLGVEGGFFTIEGRRADGDLNDERSGRRVTGPVILHGTTDDGDVGFGFGVAEGERVVLPDGKACRDRGVEAVAEESDDV